jgi:hypothetical protein
VPAPAAPPAIFPFDRNFQIAILALTCQRHEFAGIATELIEPSYFEDQTLIWFFQQIKAHYTVHAAPPSVLVIQNELKKATRTGIVKPAQISDFAVIAKTLSEPVTDPDYITNELVKFCRRQQGRKVYLETAPLMDSANDATWDNIVDKITQIPAIGLSLRDTGIDPTQWDLLRDPPRTAFGIHPVDEIMRGGLKPGQLGALIGGPGSGKSLGLLHIGIMGIYRKLNVLYISMELGEDDIAERFSAATTDIPLAELLAREVELKARQAYVRWQHQGRFRIKFFPTATVSTIRAYLRQLASQGWKPDLLLVDYGDLLSVNESKGSDYADQGNAFAQLRVLANDLMIPCWTATQANRAAFQADKVSQEHIADSLRKARICDVLIGISAKPDERQDNIARLNFTKNRNGRENVEVTIKTAYDRAQFCNIMQTATFQSQQTQHGTPGPNMPSPVAASPS